MKQKYILSEQEKWEIITPLHLTIWICSAFCLRFILSEINIPYSMFTLAPLWVLAFFPIFYYILSFICLLSSRKNPVKYAKLTMKFQNDLVYIITSPIILFGINKVFLHESPYQIHRYLWLCSFAINAGFSLAKIFSFIFGSIKTIFDLFLRIVGFLFKPR